MATAILEEGFEAIEAGLFGYPDGPHTASRERAHEQDRAHCARKEGRVCVREGAECEGGGEAETESGGVIMAGQIIGRSDRT